MGTRNHLADPQMFQLFGWMTQRSAELKRDRPTMKLAAQLASTALGFPVTEAHIERARMEKKQT